MRSYPKPLLDRIEREKKGIDFVYSEEDRKILDQLFDELNSLMGTDYQYLAELDAFEIKDSAEIIARYITAFSSESVRGYLIPNLATGKVKDCDRLVLQMYRNFKESDMYISKPGLPAPAHIYVRYDNAICTLKPKRLCGDLISLARCPRDAFYLPRSMRMLASWKEPELLEILLQYVANDGVNATDVGLIDKNANSYPSIEFIMRELRFTAIAGLKYFPSPQVRDIIKGLAADTDRDISMAAKKTLRSFRKIP